MPVSRTVALSIVILVVAASAQAGTVVFSNFSQPGDVYGPDGISFGANPYLPGTHGGNIVATRFYVGTTSTLEEFNVPLMLFSGPTEFTAYLMNESAIGLPGTVIESIPITSLASGPPVPLTTIMSAAQPELIAGTPYWFGVSAGTNTFAQWSFTTFKGVPLGSSNFAIQFESLPDGWLLGEGGPDGREGAFRVVGVPTPEPGSALLTCLGLALGLARFRHGLSVT